ncbi:uncharacterized protein LOC110840122 [Zootermopsis nevadensis]|uniref:uncharacterized protein LOC110840122 n=1 Tax=Zootermopsis nevadensis TaxID=136037 RepID=UPI000B8EE721|nr:uncharacterized protein LOC110840122 [Zootermopsis nevadensis]
MAFWKSNVPRFQENISSAPPPTKYAPKSNITVKGCVSYDKQAMARFDAGQCQTADKYGKMTTRNGTYSVRSSKVRSEIERNKGTSSTRKKRNIIKPAVKQKLSKEQSKSTSSLTSGKRSSEIKREIRNPASKEQSKSTSSLNSRKGSSQIKREIRNPASKEKLSNEQALHPLQRSMRQRPTSQ